MVVASNTVIVIENVEVELFKVRNGIVHGKAKRCKPLLHLDILSAPESAKFCKLEVWALTR